MKARFIIGANYGDEGKGKITAEYTKKCKGKVLNVLTNGGSQRAHTIVVDGREITNKHFGSGTIFGADNFFCGNFIINPIQFVMEYNKLGLKEYPRFFRHPDCSWTTPWDMMANIIRNENQFASCCMGIWETIQRVRSGLFLPLGNFIQLSEKEQYSYLMKVKNYYSNIDIPTELYDAWNSIGTIIHFLEDCRELVNKTIEVVKPDIYEYDEIIFENGQGLLLSDTGTDSKEFTPSITSSFISKLQSMLLGVEDCDISYHYVTRPYLTRHGFGSMEGKEMKVSDYIKQDTNVFNEFQGEFRYGSLDINRLYQRVNEDCYKKGNLFLEVTHCDEVDRLDEFRKVFGKEYQINSYDSPIIKGD